MIFVLLFVLLLGFLVYKKTYNSGFLKTKKRFNLAKSPKVNKLWGFRLFLFNEESKLLLKKYSKKTVKKVDDILSKVRIHCPKENLSEKERRFFYNVLNSKPIYLIKNKEEFPEIEIALKVEEFYAVQIKTGDKLDKTHYADKNLHTDKINFIISKNKGLNEVLKNLNINLPLPSNIETIFFPQNITPKGVFKKNLVLTENYLLEKYKSNEIEFSIYKFFVGQCLTVVLIKNKTMQSQVFEFDYFYDLANKNNNYFDFDIKQNFILIKNLEKDTREYFNFSHEPKALLTSAVKDLQKSNLPCVILKYEITLPPNILKQKSFMFSKTPQPLALLNFKNLLNSGEKLQEVFYFDIDFLNTNENKFFLQVLTQAKITLLNKSKTTFFWIKGTYEFLRQKFIKKEIDALSFYLSIQNNLINLQKDNIKVNPYFLEDNFVVNLKGAKSIYILKQNLKVPFVLLDGVKYYNHFTIPLDFLKNKPAKIHV